MACIRKRRGKWVLDYRDAEKVRRWQTFATKREAEDALPAALRESHQDRPPVSPNTLLKEWAETWLKQRAPDLAPRTLASYRQLLDLYVLPTLGQVPLRKLRRSHVRSLLAAHWQREVTRPDGTKTVRTRSKHTLRLIRATLSAMLSEAVDQEVLPANVAASQSRGRKKRADSMGKTERTRHVRPLTHAELAAFTKTAEARASKRDRLLFRVFADGGLRPGEGLGLHRSDVDVIGRRLLVERAVSGKDVRGTKTGETRWVDLPAALAEDLGVWLATQEAEALAADRDLGPYLFPTQGGVPQDEIRVARRFQTLLSQAGVPRHRLYDLRHTYASHALAAGAPITYVAAQLGHADATTTLRWYARWLPAGDRSWADRLATERVRAAQAAPATPPGAPAVNYEGADRPLGSKTVDGSAVSPSETFDKSRILLTERRGSSEAEQLIRNQ